MYNITNIDVGNTLELELAPLLTPGVTYYVSVTAYNADAESEYAEEVLVFLPAPGVPSMSFVIPDGALGTVEFSYDLKTWMKWGPHLRPGVYHYPIRPTLDLRGFFRVRREY
jgi:hypothetical protein